MYLRFIEKVNFKVSYIGEDSVKQRAMYLQRYACISYIGYMASVQYE